MYYYRAYYLYGSKLMQMNRFFLSILFVTGMVVAISSCNNGPYNADPNGNVSTAVNPIWTPPGINVASNGTDFFRADINGRHFDAPRIITATYDTIQVVAGDSLASDGSFKKGFSLGIPNYSSFGTGTYTLPNAKILLSFQDTLKPKNLLSIQTWNGQVIVTSKTDKSIAGTFVFTRYDSTHVTNGSFSASW